MGFVQEKIKQAFKRISDNLGTVFIASVALLVLLYVFQLFLPDLPKWARDLCSLLSTLLASLLVACFVAYIVDISGYKKAAIKSNAAEVLEVLFSKKQSQHKNRSFGRFTFICTKSASIIDEYFRGIHRR